MGTNKVKLSLHGRPHTLIHVYNNNLLTKILPTTTVNYSYYDIHFVVGWGGKCTDWNITISECHCFSKRCIKTNSGIITCI